jgi:signal transduction histidine kinase
VQSTEAVRSRQRVASDLGVALLMTVLTVAGAYGESHPTQLSDQIVNSHRTPVAPWPALLLVALAGVVLAWRRQRPVPMLGISLGAILVYTALGYVNGAAILSPMVALVAVAATARSPEIPWSARTTRRAVLLAAVVLVMLMGVTAAFNPFGPFGGSFVVIPGLVAAALLGGLAIANRRAYVEAMRQRAEFAERTREDEARRQVDAERLRIARELHDVVAHTMSTINVQAGVAAHVNTDLPESVAAALAAIRDASKNGLRELRTILAVLRQVDEPEPISPTPDLSRLETVVATARSTGLPTELTVCGQRRRLPASVELAAYRIVQESLTNVIRHAGPATVEVRLDFGADQLGIDVIDTGTGLRHATDLAGHGLTGMRERALGVGGTLEAGPRPEGGFRIRARLPLGASS